MLHVTSISGALRASPISKVARGVSLLNPARANSTPVSEWVRLSTVAGVQVRWCHQGKGVGNDLDAGRQRSGEFAIELDGNRSGRTRPQRERFAAMDDDAFHG